MGMWAHPYAVPLHVQVGLDFRDNGVWLSLYDVVGVMVEAENPH